MEVEELSLEKLVKDNKDKTLGTVLHNITNQGDVDEITIAVHPGSNLDFSELPAERKSAYLRNTRDYLEFCKKSGIKIVHFRDLLPINGNTIEQALIDKFGVEADYEIATFVNMGVPLDLINQYFEQKINYGIFCPSIYNGRNKIRVVNGIGAFTDDDACFPDGVSVMEAIAEREVRVIQECTISKTTNPFNIKDYGHSPKRVVLYSFNGRKPLS